jgi:uncharacterized membrane protein SpoIIM required for sporulation
MKKILKPCTDNLLFWSTFLIGAFLGGGVSFLAKPSSLRLQAGAYFLTIFVNNLKVALLIIIGGILTNKIFSYLLLLGNGILGGNHHNHKFTSHWLKNTFILSSCSS